jgi:hypothetical protein
MNIDILVSGFYTVCRLISRRRFGNHCGSHLHWSRVQRINVQRIGMLSYIGVVCLWVESVVDSRGVAKVVMRENGTYWKLADVVQLGGTGGKEWCSEEGEFEEGGVWGRGVWLMINLVCVWPYFFLAVGLPVARFCSAGGRPLD